jgi:hemerythrin-like domain-containing protein
MEPIARLLKEHRLIEKGVQALELLRSRLEERAQIRPKIFWMTIDFWSTYADIVHHGKEEQLLFPLLEQHESKGELSSIIDQLIDEHTQLLGYISELRLSARPFFQGDQAAQQKIMDCLVGYITTVVPHVRLEDKELFPIVSDLITEKELTQLDKDFKIFDARTGPKIHSFYEERVKKLLKELTSND